MEDLAKLLITSTETNSELNVYGGNNGAGIGGGSSGSGGTLSIREDANVTAIRKSGSSSAIDATISASQPIISGILDTPLSNTSDTNIQITDMSNNSITKSFKFPANASSFSSTVGGIGKYTIDAGDKSLVKSVTPIVDGIYDFSNPGVHEYTNMSTGYKVTFDSQGGTPAFQYGFATSGSKVNEPIEKPIKDEHESEGWYEKQNFTSKWDFTNDVVNKNTTLYAKYPLQASGIMVNVATKIPAEEGKVMLTVVPGPLDADHKIYYRVVDTKPTKMYVGALITVDDWIEVTDVSPFEINAADGKYVEAVEISVADNKVTKWGSSSEINDGYTPSYEMRLSETGTLTVTFLDEVEGYSNVTPKSITVKKTGNEDITNLTAALNGANKDSFILGNLSTETLNNTTTEATLTVQPKNGLSEGTYTAIINISADKIENQSINMSFKVRHRESKSETPAPAPTPHIPVPTPVPVLAAVTIAGTERVGKTLEAVLVTDSRAKVTTSAAVTYEWYRLSDKESNSGKLVGDDKTYKLVESDKGRYIKVIVNYNGVTFEAVTGRIESISSSSSNSSSSSHKKTSGSSYKKIPATKTSSSTEKLEATSIPVPIADGWQKQSNNTWKYGENGKSVIGWKQIKGLWYYFDLDEIMHTGWKYINGKWYYLYGDGSLAVNTILSYKVDENGVWIE